MRLFLISGRRSVHVDVDLEKIDLSRPIAWRSLAQSVMLAVNEITMRRGITRQVPRNDGPVELPEVIEDGGAAYVRVDP